MTYFYNKVKKIEEKYIFNDLQEKKLEEDKIYKTTISKYVSSLNDNLKKIWEYGFTEMVNNVLEHSEAKTMVISFAQNTLYTWVNIWDDGIGIFKKIAEYYNYDNLDDAVLNLFKGKLTTDVENHSGEGIFFTSKVMDHFGAKSSNKFFSQDNMREVFQSNNEFQKGTLIIMALSNNAHTVLKEVFDMYSSVEGGFTITKIPIKQICDEGYPVSRSQAKRLYFGFDKFEKVILDFSDVQEIGQGFAHELFTVFKNKHPEIEIQYINANDDVIKMINHVKK